MEAENQGPLVNALVWTFTALSIIAVLLRFLSRFKIRPDAGWDDLAVATALVVNTIHSVLMSIAVSKGTGSHETTLSGPEAAMKAGYWSFIAFEIGTFSFGLPKIAIALLLGRMLPLRREVYWLLVSLAGLLTLYAIGQDIVYIEQCTPTEGLWNKSIKSTCWDRRPVIISGTAFGAFSSSLDLFYAVFPFALMLRRNAIFQHKICLGIMMVLGIVAATIGFYRCSILPGFISPRTDLTWDIAPLFYCSSVEDSCLIIAACVPSFIPLIELFSSEMESPARSNSYFSVTSGRKSNTRTSVRDTWGSPAQSFSLLDGNIMHPNTETSTWDRLTAIRSDRRMELRKNQNGWFELKEVESGTGTTATAVGGIEAPPLELAYIGPRRKTPW